jgi:hypothetical protein
MNKRIRQLAEECGLLYKQLGPSVETRYMKKKEETIAAFAELIVRECIDCAKWVGRMNTTAVEPVNTAHAIVKRIEKHFEVKE